MCKKQQWMYLLISILCFSITLMIIIKRHSIQPRIFIDFDKSDRFQLPDANLDYEIKPSQVSPGSASELTR